MNHNYIIKSNKVKCALCGDIIESKSVHDFVQCTCGEITTDGGLEYFHRSARTDFKNLIDMSHVVEVIKDEPQSICNECDLDSTDCGKCIGA